jgi:HNH endonuclease
MRCIFCRRDSTYSKSREHIIPESLGNTSLVLPKGVVCDKCNNYFSREVEKPFLESDAIRALRFHEWLESKKGRVPSLPGVITPEIPAIVTRFPRGRLTSVAVPAESFEVVRRLENGQLVLPMGGRAPNEQVVSRFMAKVALEAMAARVVDHDGGQDYLCDEHQLDDLRDHARYGRISQWPVHTRRIYAANAKVSLPGRLPEQVIHESDFLATSWGEWFFVLAIFGLEFAINLGGPDIEGYERWLRENNEVSPLYRTEKPSPYPQPTSAE